MKYTFILENLDCANCAAKIEDNVKKIEEIQNASVNFMTTKMVVECENIEKDVIIEKLKKVIKKVEPDVKLREL